MIWKKKSKLLMVKKAIHETMLSYCLNRRKNTKSENPKVVRTKNGRIMSLSKYEVCDSKKSKLIKEQEASGLLSHSEKHTGV